MTNEDIKYICRVVDGGRFIHGVRRLNSQTSIEHMRRLKGFYDHIFDGECDPCHGRMIDAYNRTPNDDTRGIIATNIGLLANFKNYLN